MFHHSILAYYAKAPLPAHSLLTMPRWWEDFPVVDPAKWSGFTPIVLFNDCYGMAVLFFVSGLFSWGSLKRKGTGAYFKDRLLRLGVPLILMALLAPATYYASYLQARMHDGFWHEWLSLPNWPSGPAWFLAALLIFDVIAIAIYKLAPSTLEAAGRRLARIRNPSGMLWVIIIVSSIFYVPALLRFGPYEATILFIPVSRLLHDLSYFLIGLALGSAEPKNSVIVAGGRVAARWTHFLIAAPCAFGLWQAVAYLSHRHYHPLLWGVLVGISFCLCCAVSAFAVLSAFLHFVRKPHPIWDSLLACSFGIYIIHYVLITWIQMGLLHVPAPAWLKGPAVFLIVFPICWYAVSIARRNQWIARFI